MDRPSILLFLAAFTVLVAVVAVVTKGEMSPFIEAPFAIYLVGAVVAEGVVRGRKERRSQHEEAMEQGKRLEKALARLADVEKAIVALGAEEPTNTVREVVDE